MDGLENGLEKIDFLDGFRDILAIWVLMKDSTTILGIKKYFLDKSAYIGVIRDFYS